MNLDSFSELLFLDQEGTFFKIFFLAFSPILGYRRNDTREAFGGGDTQKGGWPK